MVPPSVFGYRSYVSFLRDHYAYKTERNPNFNFTLWSKKLGLSNVATLTRLLSGDRVPGPEVQMKLCQYFEFTKPEKEYFLALVRLQKEQDPSLRALCEKQLAELRKSSPDQGVLLTFKARNLILWGSADLQGLNEALSPFGFEGILSYAGMTSSVCLNGAYVYDSRLGHYAQFCLACYGKRQGHPWAQSEMFFFNLLANDSRAVQAFRSWDSPYEERAMKCSLDPGSYPMSFELLEDRAEDIRLSFAAPMQPLQSDRQINDIFAYNTALGAKEAFRMSFDSTAYFREFDPSRDLCRWREDSRIGKTLRKIRFKPAHWTYQPEFTCTFFPHEKR